MKHIKFFQALAVISFVVIIRLLPHPANVAPVAALALFSGVYLSKKQAFLLPLVSMLISDLFLGFHSTMIFVYGSFLLTALIGIYLKKYKTVFSVGMASVFSSLLFFLLTNFGVWSTSNMYEKSVHGLFQSYVMGIPFYRNTFIGDLFYTLLFFGTYEVFRFFLSNRFAKANK